MTNNVFMIGWRVGDYYTNKILNSINTDHSKLCDKHHVTVVYSKTFPKGKLRMDIDIYGTYGKITDVEVWQVNGVPYTVAIISSPQVLDRHDYFTKLGCTYDHEYRPHITLAKGLDVSESCQGLIGMVFRYDYEYTQFL